LDRPKRSIILVGMMGCGKSTVGHLLARRLGWRFVDTDAVIEARAGRGIPEIFERLGEPAFREMEAEAIAGLPGESRLRIVAVGGGALMRDDNIEALRRLGTLVYLKVTPVELARRLGAARQRPLLAGEPDKAAAAADLLEGRRARYEQADVVVCTDGFDVPRAVLAVLDAVLGYERERPDHDRID